MPNYIILASCNINQRSSREGFLLSRFVDLKCNWKKLDWGPDFPSPPWSLDWCSAFISPCHPIGLRATLGNWCYRKAYVVWNNSTAIVKWLCFNVIYLENKDKELNQLLTSMLPAFAFIKATEVWWAVCSTGHLFVITDEWLQWVVQGIVTVKISYLVANKLQPLFSRSDQNIILLKVSQLKKSMGAMIKY